MYMRKDYGLATNLMKTKCAKGRTTNRKVIARGEEGGGGGGGMRAKNTNVNKNKFMQLKNSPSPITFLIACP